MTPPRKTTSIALLAMLLLCGCQKSGDAPRGELQVYPESATLIGDEKSILLTAIVSADPNGEPLSYPLLWTVSDSAAGKILAQSAEKAVYTHTTTNARANAVIVRDQLGREGLASIIWQPE